MASQWIFEADSGNFQERVIERSRATAVLVDFWAPWCGPCRLLGPILEKVVNDHKGELLLAKVNTDENQDLAYRFGIQGIPAVKVFADGLLAGEFVGALPEHEVRRFVQPFIKTESDRQARTAAGLESESRWEEALAIYRKILEEDPKHPMVWTGRLRALVALNRLDEANGFLQEIPADLMADEEVNNLQTKVELARVRQKGESIEDLKKELEEDPDDLEIRYQLAAAYAARENYREALEALLAIVRKDRRFREDGARQMMVRLFEVIGVRNPLAEEYREKLARLIY